MMNFAQVAATVLVLIIIADCRKVLEIQTKTSSDTNAGMNGKLAVEICDSELNCCNAGELDSDRDDFNHGHVDVFWGGGIRECQEYELASGNALMVVTHNGIDMWKGDWIRIILDGGEYLDCPIGFEMDNLEMATVHCA